MEPKEGDRIKRKAYSPLIGLAFIDELRIENT